MINYIWLLRLIMIVSVVVFIGWCSKKEWNIINDNLHGQMTMGRGIPLVIMFPIVAITVAMIVWIAALIFGGI